MGRLNANGMALVARGHLAWVHQWSRNRHRERALNGQRSAQCEVLYTTHKSERVHAMYIHIEKELLRLRLVDLLLAV